MYLPEMSRNGCIRGEKLGGGGEEGIEADGMQKRSG
jgi:hypothetical protein